MANGKKPRRRPISKVELAMRNPVWLSNKHAPMQEPGQAKLVVDARMALHRITAGECRPDDPDEIAIAANVAMVLCEEKDEAREYLALVKQAQEALLAAQRRANQDAAFHSFVFQDAERTVVADLLALYEQMLALFTHAEVMRAMAECARRIRSGNAYGANWSPGVGHVAG